MTIIQATQLIAPATLLPHPSQQWADLGCGAGTFSYALAALLPTGSHITCIDQQPQRIDAAYNGISLQFEQADFQKIDFTPGSLSGILMANSLHYIRDQRPFVKRLEKFLLPNASCIIVEYDTDSPNQWVPYPLSFHSISNLFSDFGDMRKLNERASIYGDSNLYACQITRRSIK